MESTFIVDVSSSIKKYKPKYKVMIKPSKQDVLDAMSSTDKVFIFIFDNSQNPADSLDYSWLQEYPSNYVVNPIYIGNFKESDHEKVIEQIIKTCLGLEGENLNQE